MFSIVKKYISQRQDISKKNFAAIFILLFNTLSWYYMVWEVLFRNYENFTLMWIGFDISIVISMLFGAVFLRKSGTSKFLFGWICFGVFSSLLFMFGRTHAVYLPIISSLFGISIGLGVPYSISVFAELIDIKNRGLAAGIILLLTLIVIPLAIIVITSKYFGDLTDSLLLAAWRGGGLTIFIFKPKLETKEKTSTFKSILRDRSFILYFIPWIMFLSVNQLESLLLKPFFESYFGQPTPKVGPIFGALFSLIGGFLADTTGRRRVVIYGFASLGFAYALLSLSHESLLSWYFFFFMNGAAWGIIFVCFTLILWGDLSQNGDREKYYAIGGMPFFLADLLRLPSFPLTEPITSFSLASLFLFVAVIPLMFAPETLPEKKLRERELRQYIEKAKKIKEKFT